MKRDIRQAIIERLVKGPLKKPAAVLSVGSVVRGCSDRLSDLDFVIVWKRLKDNIWPEGACRVNGQKCGIRNTTFDSLSSRNWSQIERHAYSFAKIEYDPQNLMRALIKEKCVWQKGEKVNLFCEGLFKLSYVVNVVDNYKNCWNERDELEMAIARGQRLLALYLTTDFIYQILTLAIITDGAFIPSHKVCFSEWIRNISPRAYEIYQATMSNLELIKNPDVSKLKQFYRSYVQNLIESFESQERLPDNIMEHRNQIVRLSKI